MDQRIKNIKTGLNEILESFPYPEFAHDQALLSFGLREDADENQKAFNAKLEDFERKFKIVEEREKLLFSEDEFERNLISQLPKDIFVWTAFKGIPIFQKYFSDAAAGELDEKTADEAFEFYYSTDEDYYDYESKIFLLWNLLQAEKLPEFVLVKWEAFIEI